MNVYQLSNLSKARLIRLIVNVYERAGKGEGEIMNIIDNPNSSTERPPVNKYIDINDTYSGKEFELNDLSEVRRQAKKAEYGFVLFNDQIFLTEDNSLSSILEQIEPTIKAIVSLYSENVAEAIKYLKHHAPTSRFYTFSEPFDSKEGNYVFEATLTKVDLETLKTLRDVAISKKI